MFFTRRRKPAPPAAAPNPPASERPVTPGVLIVEAVTGEPDAALVYTTIEAKVEVEPLLAASARGNEAAAAVDYRAAEKTDPAEQCEFLLAALEDAQARRMKLLGRLGAILREAAPSLLEIQMEFHALLDLYRAAKGETPESANAKGK
jgi:hypothetical protein